VGNQGYTLGHYLPANIYRNVSHEHVTPAENNLRI